MTEAPTHPRILLVEDERGIWEALALAFSREAFEVQQCSLGRDAIAAVRSRAPDLVVLDVGLPDTTGFEVCKALRSFSEVPIIFLTARGEELDRVLGLELGADDYLSKPFSPRELIARVRAVLKRSRGTGAPLVAQTEVGLRRDPDHACIRWRGEALALTRAEYLLLGALMEAKGRVLSRSQMMAAWDDPDMTGERTVDVHVRALRAKLKLAGADPACIATHRGFGYSYLAGDEP